MGAVQTSALDARSYPLWGVTAAAIDKYCTRTPIAPIRGRGYRDKLHVWKQAVVGGDVRHATDVVAAKDEIVSSPVYRRPGSAFNFGFR